MNDIDRLLQGLNSGVRCTVRTGLAGRHGIDWSEPREVVLDLDRDRAGRLRGLSIRGEDFAEFDPRHHIEGDGQLLAEDHAIEVMGVVAPDRKPRP